MPVGARVCVRGGWALSALAKDNHAKFREEAAPHIDIAEYRTKHHMGAPAKPKGDIPQSLEDEKLWSAVLPTGFALYVDRVNRRSQAFSKGLSRTISRSWALYSPHARHLMALELSWELAVGKAVEPANPYEAELAALLSGG